MALVSELAQRQLDAYNLSDLDAFCACYHPDVVVLDDQKETVRGIEAFRARYVSLFEKWEFWCGRTSETGRWYALRGP